MSIFLIEKARVPFQLKRISELPGQCNSFLLVLQELSP